MHGHRSKHLDERDGSFRRICVQEVERDVMHHHRTSACDGGNKVVTLVRDGAAHNIRERVHDLLIDGNLMRDVGLTAQRSQGQYSLITRTRFLFLGGELDYEGNEFVGGFWRGSDYPLRKI